MNNLKCRKQGFNKYVCKRTNKEIKLCDCRNCPYKEYKDNNYVKTLQKKDKKFQSSAELKKKSSKLAKLERNRFSLFTDNKDKCMFCDSTYKLTWHEIYCGRNRQNSMKYGLCLRMCLRCHEIKQEDKQFNEEWKQKGQVVFQQTYPNLVFEEIFKKNYLK